MSISDDLMYRYYELCTDLSSQEVDRIRNRVAQGSLHPKAAKVDLAKRIVREFHSRQAADRAEEEFHRIHSQRLLPDKMEEKRLPVSQERLRLSKLMVRVGLAASVGQAVRLISQDAVSLNQERGQRCEGGDGLLPTLILGIEGWQAGVREGDRGVEASLVVARCSRLPDYPRIGRPQGTPLGLDAGPSHAEYRCGSVNLICLLPQIRLLGITLVDTEQLLK